MRLCGGGGAEHHRPICLNRLDAAERLMIARLEGERPEEALLPLQNYRMGGADRSPMAKLLRDRFDMANRARRSRRRRPRSGG